MARIKLGPMVTNISGSIGGLTIQRNRYGITMRQKPLSPKSDTIAQYDIRQKIITIQAAWQALTDAQRLQWDRFMDFSGQSIKADRSVKLSGHALYLKYQLMRLMSKFSLLTNITYIPMPSYEMWNNITIDFNDLVLDFDNDPSITTRYFTVFLSSPRQSNKAFSSKGLRFCYAMEVLTLVFQLEDGYNAAFGVLPPVGATLHYTTQFFSLLAPVFAGKVTGTLIVQ